MARIDKVLVEEKYFTTRSKALLAIKDGIVFYDGKIVSKGGLEIEDASKIQIKGQVLPYVSRGGLKLAKAIEEWKIDLKNKIMIDIGSSTGGFSDVALRNGIAKIYAIDVGKDQFDKELLKDRRIVLFEQTDFRNIDNSFVADADFASIDVSFISVTKLLEKISTLSNLKEIVCLIKPQFECGKEVADKFKGVIKDELIRKQAIDKVIQAFKKIGFSNTGLIDSPIKGGDGNNEYLAHLQR